MADAYKKYRAQELARFAEFARETSQKSSAELAKFFSLGGPDSGRRIWNDIASGKSEKQRLGPEKYAAMRAQARAAGLDRASWAGARWKFESALAAAEGTLKNRGGELLTRDQFEQRAARVERDQALPEERRRAVRWAEASADVAEQKAAALRDEVVALLEDGDHATEELELMFKSLDDLTTP